MKLDQIEYAARGELEELQLERLRDTVERVVDAVAPMRERLHAAGVDGPGDIASLDDLGRLPFTVKTDLRDQYPFGMFVAPRARSCGSTPPAARGAADRRGVHTRRPRPVGGRAGARAGGRRRAEDDVLQNAAGYGLFTGGLGFHDAATGSARRWCRLVGEHGAPGDAAARLRRPCAAARRRTRSTSRRWRPGEGVDRRGSRSGPGSWAPSRCPRRSRTRSRSEALYIYGLSEVIGPGVASNCAEWAGRCTSGTTTTSPRSWTRTAASGCRRARRRAGVHGADQGGAAGPALPDARLGRT